MTESASPITCPACQIIDAADGVIDGNLFATISQHMHHESHLVETFKRAEDRAADAVTAFAGSLNFVYIHAVWFGIWIALNVGLIGASLKFDKFPFGLLTMIVSLEAIFLATFVMVSQNRQAARSDIRAQLDYETNLRSEIWSIHIGQALRIDPAHVESVVAEAIEGSKRES